MDSTHFDSLAKVVGALTSRRSALLLLAGLGLGSVDLTDSEARKSGKCKRRCTGCERCKRGKCQKKDGKKRCSKGKCKSRCSANQVCQNGSCFPTGACPATTTGFCSATPQTCSAPADVCVCDRSTEGNVVCITTRDANCGNPACTTSANCPAGSACVDISGCCMASVKICLPQCPAPVPAAAATAGV